MFITGLWCIFFKPSFCFLKYDENLWILKWKNLIWTITYLILVYLILVYNWALERWRRLHSHVWTLREELRWGWTNMVTWSWSWLCCPLCLLFVRTKFTLAKTSTFSNHLTNRTQKICKLCVCVREKGYLYKYLWSYESIIMAQNCHTLSVMSLLF